MYLKFIRRIKSLVWIGYSSPTESAIMEDLDLGLSFFGRVMTIGEMLGAVLSGRIANLLGRRGVPVYIAVITPKNLRGGFATVHQFMISFGSAVTYFVGTVVSWSTLALIAGTIPCLAQLIGLLFILESPRWLKECEVALQHLRGQNADITPEATEIREYTETLQLLSEASILDLFQWKYAHSLIVGVGLMALQQFGGVNGIAFYASAIFISAEEFSGSIGTIAMVIVQVLDSLWVILIDKSRRRPLLLVRSLVTFVSWLGSWIVSNAFNFLMDWSSASNAKLFLIALVTGYCSLFRLGCVS
ncbi:hypothetical protein ACB098_04G074900 [Castanea mollissima]